MYSLLDKNQSLDLASRTPMNVRTLIDKHKTNIEKQIAFYRRTPVHSNAVGLLLKLMHVVSISSETGTPMEAFNLANDKLDLIAGNFDFTSENRQGDVHRGIFFGKETPSIIIAVSETRAHELILSSNWKELSPVKVLRTPTIKDNLARPDLAEHEYGLGVIKLDLPLFAFMAANFIKSLKPDADGNRPNLTEFITRYVLPNAMRSMADIQLLNLITANKEDIGSKTTELIPDVTPKLYKEINDFLPSISPSASLEEILTNIPAVYHENMFEALEFPRGFVGIMNFWGYFASYSWFMSSVIQIGSDSDSGKDIVNRFKKLERKVKMEGTLRKIPDIDVKTELSLEFDFVKLAIESY